MGEILEANTGTAKACLPGLDYALYGDEEIQDFLKDHFDQQTLVACRRLAPYAYKADLARYCLLHKLGGWYLDVGIHLTGVKINVADGIGLVAFRDQTAHSLSPFACANGAIYAKPEHPATAKAIELVINNVNKEYYGVTPLCPTGPTLWGRAIAMAGVDSTHLFGYYQELTPAHTVKNKALLLPDGTIFALGKQSEGGDLQALGAQGTNNYNDYWHCKTVYTTPQEG